MRTRLLIQESEAGKSGGKLLIESASPERENAKAKTWKANPASTGNRTRKSLIESETKNESPEESPR
ncbi:hypothetical protein, partial [Streptomyces sp. A1547]|uniref:hypothetical protein n=1 Tax=Streptomyces sp. A1547 TaxID=2563105 RepID=UPI0019D25EF6